MIVGKTVGVFSDRVPTETTAPAADSQRQINMWLDVLNDHGLTTLNKYYLWRRTRTNIYIYTYIETYII